VLLDESVRAVMSGRGSNSPTPLPTGERTSGEFHAAAAVTRNLADELSAL